MPGQLLKYLNKKSNPKSKLNSRLINNLPINKANNDNKNFKTINKIKLIIKKEQKSLNNIIKNSSPLISINNKESNHNRFP